MTASTLRKIISGGQTGVDRGALDAALQAGFPCGGWCPEGRLAEDGRIPDRYPVLELAGAGYRKRTLQNVLDSGATLVLFHGELTGGTRETVRFCERHGKLHLLIDAAGTEAKAATELAAAFIASHGIVILNVAGPRESAWRGADDFSYGVISALLVCAQDT